MKFKMMMGVLATSAAVTSGAAAGLVEASNVTPVLDRWVYPFASNPGAETTAYCFTSLGNPGGNTFDDHDGQFLIGWDTAAAGVTPGQALNRYRVMSATVTVRVSADQVFKYDPSYDSYKCLLETSDPDYVADADGYQVTPTEFAAHPVELFVCGYRNGWTQATYLESSPFKPTGTPFRGTRNVFAATMDANGVVTDVSNNVGFRFESSPIAVGQCAGVTPGALVPLNTDMTFQVDLTSAGTIRYLREGLAAGRVNLMVSSLAQAPQQVLTVPTFYTREGAAQSPDPAARAPRLTLNVCVGHPADWDCNGIVSIDDLFFYFNAYFTGNADFDANGITSIDDLFGYINAYFLP